MLDGRFLAWRLFIRNVRSQYRQSVLGILWAFLPPLVTALVWVFLKQQSVFAVAETPVPYPVFVLTGTILWQVFLDGLNIPLRVFTQSKSMLTKINFPREALILASIYEVMFNLLVKFVLLIGIYAWFAVLPTVYVLFGILGVIMLALLGTSISLLLTPLALLYGDIKRAILISTQFLFFLTPIIYPVPKEGAAKILAQINPIAHLLTPSRDWLTTGDTLAVDTFMITSVFTLIALICGMILYRIALPHLVERMGS